MNLRLCQNQPRPVDLSLARFGMLLAKREELKALLAITERKLKTSLARRGLSEAQLLHMVSTRNKS